MKNPIAQRREAREARERIFAWSGDITLTREFVQDWLVYATLGKGRHKLTHAFVDEIEREERGRIARLAADGFYITVQGQLDDLERSHQGAESST